MGQSLALDLDDNTFIDSTAWPAFRIELKAETGFSTDLLRSLRHKSTKAVRFFNSAVAAPDTLRRCRVVGVHETRPSDHAKAPTN